MNGNYRRLNNLLKGYFENGVRARRFIMEFEDQLELESDKSKDFPIVFFAYKRTEENEGTTVFIGDLYCLDVTTEGRENVLDVVSDTHQTLRDFLHVVLEDQLEDLGTEEGQEIEPINNYTVDGLTGNCIFDLRLELDGVDYCEAV